MKERNYLVSLLKLFLAYDVAVAHFNSSFVFIVGRWCVDYFFIISGFFLCGSFRSKKYENAGIYTLNRLVRIYPFYFWSLALLVTYGYISGSETVCFADLLANRLPEALLVQNVGWFDGGINYPLWFLCDLIVVSHVLFALLHHDEQLTLDVICPLIILLFGAYFNNVYTDHEVDLWGVAGGVFYVPLWRCACFLAIGMVMHHSQQAFYQLVHYQPGKQSRTWLYALAATLSWLLFLHTRNSAASYLPFMLFFMLSFTIHVPCLERLSLVRAGSALADKLSLMVFFNHALAIHLTKDLAGAYGWGNQDKITLLFIALTTALAIAGHVIVSHLIVQHRGQKARHAA